MLIGGILAAVVVVGIAAAAVVRRRSQDDDHSVEHYHRQLHTLEEIRTHPAAGSVTNGANGDGDAAFPASALRMSGSSAVRLTDDHTIVPPVPPPPVPNPAEPVLFEDHPPEPQKSAFMTGLDDRALHSINRRPRRLGAPLAAIGVVAVLIVVLVVTGLHSNPPAKHPTSGTATTATTAPARSHHSGTSDHQTSGHNKSTTSTTVPPVVSEPVATSPNGANYQVAASSYSLALSAKGGECWVSATNTSTGAVLFTGILAAGESHTVAATGPVTVVAGAPAAFAATVNGTAVQLPFGFQAPFTLKFVTPASG